MPTDAENQALDTTDETVMKPFDDLQQKKVNELIEKAMGRAGGEARREALEIKNKLTTLTEELAQAKDDLTKARTITQKGEASADVAALEARISEMQSAHKNVQSDLESTRKIVQQKENEVKRANENAINIRKEIILTQAATKINPFDVELVVQTTKDSIAWDAENNKFVVVDPASQQPRLNSSFDPMSIDEFYAEFATRRPYMVKNGSRSGTGASESGNLNSLGTGKFTHKQIFGKESNSMLAAKLSREDPKEYTRLKTLARADGTIGW